MTQSSVHGEGTRPDATRRSRRAGAGPSRGGTGGAGDGSGKGSGGSSGSGHGKRSGRRRAGGRRHRALRWSATTLAVLILATAGAGYLYYEHLNGNIEKGERSSGDSKAQRPEPNAAGQRPLNILMIGSDSRASDANVALGGGKNHRDNPPLGDVQMLIHLAADRKSAAVVSIPRDTRVDIPACTDPETDEAYPATNTIINESLGRGGAGCTLATWQNLTGVYIDHWMTIDFAGVVSMADAVGGVEVCVNQNVWDRPLPRVPGGSGLKMTAGSHKVQGEQALQWLRTRHAWGSDLLRARAQHMYMNSMIRTLKQQNIFTDTGRLMGLAEAATKSLTVSEEVGTVKKLYDLGMQLKTVPTDRITMTTMPTVEDPQDRNHLLPAPDADQMWAMLRDDVSFDDKGGSAGKDDGGSGADGGSGGKGSGAGEEDPGEKPSRDSAAPDSEIGVLVQNATRSATLGPVGGRAGTIAEALVEQGFDKAAKDSSASLSEERTVVRYPSAESEGDALRVAEALGIPAASVRKSADVSGITLVVGADWRSGTSYPKQRTPEAGDLPDTSDALNGSDTSKCMDVYKPYRW
ncbi:Cell envelope-associated transcriptional attenuator LytR-CpsA-Psr [Streptomyces ambofaciens ATCC 23877]|uniref:Cell envelope-associated transcriptional attenuator LytR-CpsA-Psr n=1 Tax=Streptomyces ambofaciens (strain ATCC 23877 / 3486 / DSM 40053 / JCM 4204 / NBRC 12836 / NRRL B-2516) TaxID=278992 RepID=A0A0K2ASN6_STRA7|nr:LCP family protein [Streptomyces ambofaciens]AKZ56135.1 Cell envelope-associated transcriptional attenuator LytR-CpsA-Psr [Streptomyces ambofaciens ATCC 23877]